MAWRSALSRNLQELRIHLCQTGKGSEGARDFVLSSYQELKKANPLFPILVREASGVEAKLIARYDFGVEEAVRIEGLSKAEIGKQLEALDPVMGLRSISPLLGHQGCVPVDGPAVGAAEGGHGEGSGAAAWVPQVRPFEFGLPRPVLIAGGGDRPQPAFPALPPLPIRRGLLQASLEHTLTLNGTGVSGGTTGTPASLTCACGFVKSLRVGVLPVNGTYTVAAVGDVKLVCPSTSGDVIVGGSDLPDLDYTTVPLNSGLGEDAIGLLLGTDAITQLAGVAAAGASGASASLSCPTAGNVFIGLYLETLVYEAGGSASPYAQLIRLGGMCATPTASDIQCTSITVCPSGQILDATSGVCEACLSGTYQDGSACTKCPTGTYNALGGQAGAGSCLPCPTGKYAPTSGSESCTYPPLGSRATGGGTGYAWCPPGSVGRTDRTACEPCPPGYYRPGGSAQPSDNVCRRIPSGFRASWLGDQGGARLVSACPAGTVSSWSDTVGVDALWWPGRTAVDVALRSPPNATLCTACQDNTYAALPGSTICELCKAGYYPSAAVVADAVYWTSTDATPGRNYSQWLQTGCTRCPPLYWKPATDTSISCSPCGPGSATNAADGAYTCTVCPPGYVNPNQTEVFGGDDPDRSFYSPAPGESSYYSAPPSGALGVSTTCQPCPKGTAQSGWGQTKCAWCPAGAGTDDVGNAACNPCPAGAFSTGPLENCRLAAPGHYVQVAGATTQTQCRPGTYSKDAGSDSCTACPAGRFASNYNSTTCTPCTAGTYASGGNARCKACPAGTYSVSGARACVPCSAGQYNALSAQCKCTSAPAGTFAPGKGNKAYTPCPKGQYTNKPGQTSCRTCGPDTYQPLAGKTSCIPCCPGGTFGVTCFRWTRGQLGSAACSKSRVRRLG
eukprot:scaffold1.g5690.t1